MAFGSKDVCVLEVDDVEDMERIHMLIDDRPPDGFHVVNTQTIPGLEELEIVRNLQMFTQVSRTKVPVHPSSGPLITGPSKYFDSVLQVEIFRKCVIIKKYNSKNLKKTIFLYTFFRLFILNSEE